MYLAEMDPIWMTILVFVLTFLFSGKKNRKNRKNNPDEVEFDDLSETEPSGHKGMPGPVKLPDTGDPMTQIRQRLRELKQHMEHKPGMQDAKPARPVHQAAPAPKKKAVPSSEGKTLLSEEKPQPASDLVTDFDLRKAIVYSEIMRPKFKDEE